MIEGVFAGSSKEESRAKELLEAYYQNDETIIKEEAVQAPSGMSLLLLDAGLTNSTELIIYSVLAGVVIFLIGSLFFPILITSLLVLVLIPLTASIYIQRKISKRVNLFDRDFPTFLQTLSSSVKAGLEPQEAISTSRSFMKKGSLLGEEIDSYKSLITKGTRKEEALIMFGDSVRHPDIALFSAALIISDKEGASIGESLQRLSRVVRNRQSFKRKSKTAVATQRFSGIGICFLAVFIVFSQYLMNKDAFITAINSPLGVKVFSISAVMFCLGVFWLMKITKIKD